MSTIEDLEERLNTFEASLLQIAENLVPQTAKVDDTANKVEQITPYTETKTAYIGDTETTFIQVPQGNLSVFFDKVTTYSIERTKDTITLKYEPLEEVTNITISIQ